MNYKQLIYRCFIFLLLIYACRLNAQHPLFKNLGVNEGLPSSATYFVLNDSKGYIWAASDLGLSKFNGRNFKNFSIENGLIDNSVICLSEDSKGRIWTASFNGSICFIENDSIHQIKATPTLVKKLKEIGGVIYSIQFDEDDNLWIGTSRNLYKILQKGNYSTFVEIETFDDLTLCVVKLLGKNKCIASQYKSRVDKISIQNGTAKLKVQFQTHFISKPITIEFAIKSGANPKTTALPLKNGTILFSYMNELYQYANGTLQPFKTYNSNILFLYEDADNNIYVSLSNSNGIICYTNGDFTKQGLKIFSGNSIGSICQDFEKGMWFTSTGNGLYYVPYLHSYNYPNYPTFCQNINAITSFNDLIIVADNKNNIYSLNSEDSIKLILAADEFNGDNKANFTTINNRLFYNGSNTFEFNPQTYSNTKQTSDFPNISTNGIIETNEQQFVGLAYTSVCKIKGSEWQRWLNLPDRGNSICYNKIDSSIWIGTRNGLYTLKNERFKKIDHPYLNSEKITFLYRDVTDSSIYVCTKNGGLFIYKNFSWKNINTELGLISNFCKHVTIDKQNTVWVSTNKGVSYFSKFNPYKINTIDRFTGLNSDEVESTAHLGNYLYIASKSGIIKVLKTNLNISFHKPIHIAKVLNKDVILRDTLVHYDNNNIKFIIDCITYKRLYTQAFAYQLKGFNDSVNTTANEYIEFSNLPSGKYELWLGNISSNGKMDEMKKYFSFTILPPFWERWWFYVLIAAGLAGLIWVIVKWRVAISNAKTEEKNKIDKLISESQITAIRAQMNPHFIFNSINSIQDFVLNNETQQAYDYLSKFAKLIRLVLQNSKENYITIEKEIEWIKIYVELEQLRFKNSFQFQVRVDAETQNNLDLKIPNMLLQPYIENAIWHGLMPIKNNTNAALQLIFNYSATQLEIIIEDNGVGRAYSENQKSRDVHTSMGMKLVEDKLFALSKISQQTLTVNVIDLYSNQQPSGTRVQILLEL